jgi:chemotaxis signal transduction protein
VLVEAGLTTFGVFAEGVAGPVRVGADELAPPPAGLPPDRRALIRGVTQDVVSVVDLDALARDPRLMVNEEVG